MTAAVRTRIRPVSATAVDQALAAPDLRKSLRLKIENREPGELKPSGRALHIYNRRQRRAVRASIKKLSICRPILVDANDEIIDGHLIWQEAKELKLATVPVICIDHLSAEDVRLLRRRHERRRRRFPSRRPGSDQHVDLQFQDRARSVA